MKLKPSAKGSLKKDKITEQAIYAVTYGLGSIPRLRHQEGQGFYCLKNIYWLVTHLAPGILVKYLYSNLELKQFEHQIIQHGYSTLVNHISSTPPWEHLNSFNLEGKNIKLIILFESFFP